MLLLSVFVVVMVVVMVMMMLLLSVFVVVMVAEMHRFGSGSEEGSFPEILADCGRKAHSWLRWYRHKMEDCVRKRVEISVSCAQCFSEAGQYGFRNCKSKCLRKWCKAGCLGCTADHNARTEQCVGVDVEVPQPDEC